MFDRELTIPPSRPATRQAAARRTGQAGPPRQRLVLDRAEHGGILPSGRKLTTQTHHPVTLLRCPSYWWRYRTGSLFAVQQGCCNASVCVSLPSLRPPLGGLFLDHDKSIILIEI